MVLLPIAERLARAALRARGIRGRVIDTPVGRVNVYATVREDEDDGATLRLGPLAHQAAWVAIEAFLGRPLDPPA